MLQTVTRLFPLWAVLFSAAAYLFPRGFAPLEPSMVPLLGVVMFGMGMSLEARDFRQVLRRPGVLGAGMALQYGLMPFWAWAVGRLLGLEPSLLAGLVLVGACPGGTASNVVCYLARGDLALSILLTALSTLLAVFFTPLLTWVYAGRAVPVPVASMLLSILKIVIVPVVLGVAINTWGGRGLAAVKGVFPLVSVFTICLLIAIIVALNRGRIETLALPVTAAVVLHNLAGLASGFFLARLMGYGDRQCRTLAIEVGMQNSGLAVVLAAKFFSPAAALPGAVFSIWHNLSGSFLAGFWRKREPRPRDGTGDAADRPPGPGPFRTGKASALDSAAGDVQEWPGRHAASGPAARPEETIRTRPEERAVRRDGSRGAAGGSTLIVLVLLGSCLSLASCGSQSVEAYREIRVPEGCQPLTLDSCLLPFPSSFYEVADPSTATGLRVELPGTRLPVSRLGVELDTDLFTHRDGFSPSPGVGILVYLGSRIDPAGLPPIEHPEASLAADSLVRLFRVPDGERVALFAELDAQAGDDPRQALKIRPVKRLDPATRYVCALMCGLKDASGADVAVPEPFRSLRDGVRTTSPAVERMRARTNENLAFLEAHGAARPQVLLAWDFTTASEACITGPMVTMRDAALEQWDGRDAGYTVSSVEDFPSGSIRRRIRGTFRVPWFLKKDGRLNRGEDGDPAMAGWGEAPFVAQIPRSAATAAGASPVLVFGHGFLGSAEKEMGSDYQRGLVDELRMVEVGTDWIGLSKHDVLRLARAVLNLNDIALVTDRLMQAQVNFVILARLLRRSLCGDPAFRIGGEPRADPAETYYLGISNGGIHGGTFMALTPDVVRGVLNVPGAVWSLMMERSLNFDIVLKVLALEYEDPLDRQLLLRLVQVPFDAVDPVHFAPRAVNDPLGTPPKDLLLQESYGDTGVPNLATETLARTMGLRGLSPLARALYGIPEASSPLPGSGIVLYDTHPSPLPPPANLPPAGNNIAHEACRRLWAVVDQMHGFLRPGGQIVQTCGGPCDPGSGYVPWSPVPPP